MGDLIFLHTNLYLRCFSRMPISNIHESTIVMKSIDTRFFRNVFEAVQKTLNTCFIGSKTTRLPLVVLNPILKHSCLFFKHYLIFTINQFITIFRGITEELHFVLDKRTSLKVSLASIKVYTKLKKRQFRNVSRHFPLTSYMPRCRFADTFGRLD